VEKWNTVARSRLPTVAWSWWRMTMLISAPQAPYKDEKEARVVHETVQLLGDERK
jgi:hypothetical protein